MNQINIYVKVFPLSGFHMSDGFDQNTDHDHVGSVVLPIWPWWQPFSSPFVYVTELYTLHREVDTTELCASLNDISLYIYSSIIVTPQIIMTQEIWFCLTMDITTVWSHIFFTNLIIYTEL